MIEREWTGSFADARNARFDAATGDWLLFLDADEVLDPADAPLLRELTGRIWREAFYLVETNHTGELGDGTAVTHNALRLFRNRPEYRFEGRVHEQIAHRCRPGCRSGSSRPQVRVDHYGYLGVVRDAKEKSRRNIELLRAPARGGGRQHRSSTSTSAPSTPRRATRAAPASSSSAPGRCSPTTRRGASAPSSPR